MTTTQKGDVTELLVCAFLIRKGIKVSKPISNDLRYDLIADYKGKLIKIQVKTSHPGRSNGTITFKTSSSTLQTTGKSTRRKYTNREIDYFATVIGTDVYFIPIADTRGTEFSMRLKPSRNNQTKGTHALNQYTYSEFEKRVKK